MKVKVNPRAMLQPFHPCTADFIATTCRASCCRSTVDPTGIAVVVSRPEAVRLRARGASVDDTTGRVTPVNRRCPFQHPESHLCGLHGTDDKPLGCIASPFTINRTGTLIVRNRYRLLPCFKADGAIPVHEAHRHSLVALFGEHETTRLEEHIRTGTDRPIYLDLPDTTAEYLLHKNAMSKPTDHGHH